jgi:eukaryotic-like serine/threonine-protein kinase
MDLKPEQILHERYRIVEMLGQGGMGAVYLAWDETLETQVAVKTNFNPAAESMDQFLREARLLAALRHQNLPRVTDYFVIGKEQFLVMDYIPGDDLGQRLKNEGRQQLDDVLRWASQLNSALSYMHHQAPPVIHRDIKPANIKLTSDGEAVLVDFGIAKAQSTQAHTKTGAAGYTPGYAPPEQYGQGRTGPYSDQFSMAATMYALITRTKPADSIQRLLGKSTLTPLRKLNSDIPINVADAILKAMSLKPEDRFTTVDAFQSTLDNPDFRLGEDEKNSITSKPVGEFIEKTRIAGLLDQAELRDSVSNKSKKRGLVFILGGVGIVLCLLVTAVLLFLLPNSPLNITNGSIFTKSGLKEPSPTITLTATLIEPTLETVVISMQTNTSFPRPTLTPVFTPSSTPEFVGETGLIAFASDRGEGEFIQIWTMRVLRDQQGRIFADSFKQLTFNEGNKDQPVWSPDGSQIAYVAPGNKGNGLDIWVMNADGSNPRNVTMHLGDEFDPVWMPDGSLIAFTHHLRDAGNVPIYAITFINPNGTERTRLSTDFIEWDPSFSPDGQYLLYVISASGHDYFYFRGAHDDFQTPDAFDLRSLFGDLGEVSDPAWAPVGNQFVYTRHDGTRENIILVVYQMVQRNGMHQPTEYVLTDTDVDTDAAWSPDGRWLAFTSARDFGDVEVYLMTTAGKPQINLTNHAGVDKSPDWKPLVNGED